MAIAGVQLKAPGHLGVRTIPRTALERYEGIGRAPRWDAPQSPPPKPEAQTPAKPAHPRPAIFSPEYVLADPERAAMLLNACWYDLVETEKRAARELAEEKALTRLAARVGPR